MFLIAWHSARPRERRGRGRDGYPHGRGAPVRWPQHQRVGAERPRGVRARRGIDQPLGLIRMDYSHNFAGPVLIVPHANWRGVYETASFGAGESAHCDDFWMPANEVAQFDSMDHRANPYENDTTDVQQHRCVQIDFPGKYMGMTHLSRRQTTNGPVSWMGSLVQDAQDASGLMYRRNRQYDPTTGRFTQEDPIGLAGGLNAYGFGKGDPVNYSDPYGLKIRCKNNAACDMWASIWNQALHASRSSNKVSAAHGQLLLDVMTAIVNDEQTLVLSVENVGFRNRLRNRGNGTSPCPRVPAICGGRGDFGILVDPKADHFAGISAEIRFTHEIGHAYSYMVRNTDEDQWHNYDSVETEDHLRAIKGCEARGTHAHTGGSCN
jgi:RHS repeat-associated protein